MNNLIHHRLLKLCFYIILSLIHPLNASMISLKDTHPDSTTTLYKAIEQETHLDLYAENQVAYFAAKGEASHIISGEIPLSDDQLLFYGLSAPDEITASYLKKNLTQSISELELTNLKDHTANLSNAMFKLMKNFYKENPKIDPCDLISQDVVVSFLHLVNNNASFYVLECADGQFKPVHKYKHISLEHNEDNLHLCITMRTTSHIPHARSPIYKLLTKNKLARITMLGRPQELVERIIKTDENEHIRGLILFDINAWLMRCKHPTTSPTYKSLQTKWDECDKHSIITVNNEIEKEILEHYNDSTENLALFIEKFKSNHKANPNRAIYTTFLEDKIEQKKKLEANLKQQKPTSFFANLLNCCGPR